MKHFMFTHVDLGDCILCNGLVRYCVNELKSVTIFSKSQYYESVVFMYRDDPRIEVIDTKTTDTNECYDISKQHTSQCLEKYKTITVGFDKLNNNPNCKGFDVLFYETLGLDFNIRWTNFKVERDLIREQQLFDALSLKKGEYIFVHDDDRFHVNTKKINSNLRVVKPTPGLTNNIFDYCSIIEHAAEVHTIDSSFQLLIDSLNLSKNNYVHRYARPTYYLHHPTYKYIKQLID